MRRQLVSHRLDERGEPRNEIEHEEHDDGADDQRDEGGGHEHLAKLHGLLVVPAQALGEPAEHRGKLPARLSGANQVDHHRIERFGMAGHRFGEARAGVDRLHHRGDYLSQVEALDGVAKVGECLGDGHARGEELFEVETEIDELAATNRGTQRPGSGRGGRRARDEVEVKAAKAGLEIELVRGFHPAAPDAASGVHRPVAHRDEGHYALRRAGAGADADAGAGSRGPCAPPGIGRSDGGASRVRSTARETSLSVVDPSSTRRFASRASVTNPRPCAASSSSWAGARRATRASSSASKRRTSVSAIRPR